MPIIKVFNVWIDSTLIVGIGPLLKIQRVDPMAIAYHEMSFKFDLYCRHYIVPITTDPLSFPGKGTSTQIDSEKAYKRINAAWELLCNNMSNGIPLDLGWQDLEKDTETPPGTIL